MIGSTAAATVPASFPTTISEHPMVTCDGSTPSLSQNYLHNETLADNTISQSVHNQEIIRLSPEVRKLEFDGESGEMSLEPPRAECTDNRRHTHNGTMSSLQVRRKFSTSSLDPYKKPVIPWDFRNRFSISSFDTFLTAASSLGSWHTAPSVLGDDPKQKERSTVFRTFRKLLERNGISSLVEEESDDEFDWCGRGMHVEFQRSEPIPLEVCDSAGHGSTATVDVVKCRRVKLARKITYSNHRISPKDLLREVRALRRLKHAHVIQLIGTYRKGRVFAALLYPVANMDLAQYLEEIPTALAENDDKVAYYWRHYRDVLSEGSLCLISALRYVHESGLKHMDIKPANILLKRYERSDESDTCCTYKMYLCDFGISQAFNPNDQSQTETYPGKTPTYASPEVASGESHGRASDIFSMGCVLAEMTTVYSGLTVHSLRSYLHNRPYHTTLEEAPIVTTWVSALEDMEIRRDIILKMLNPVPQSRPSLVGKKVGDVETIDAECAHHHDPPDLFEPDDGSVE
jgi:hypothetical protein